MNFFLIISATLLNLFAGESANAQVRVPEVLNFEIAMLQQTCRRAGVDEEFLCSSEPVKSAQMVVQLNFVSSASIFEDQVWEGASAELGMTLPGGSGQYLPRVSVRKSIAAGEAQYTLRFRTFQFLSTGKPTIFETVYISTNPPSEPILLMGERSQYNENKFNQILFILTPGRSG